MQANFSTLKRDSDIFLLTGGAHLADAVNTMSGTPRRPKERLLSGLGRASLGVAGMAILAVTWFIVHAPI